ncbi:MAG: hypothetical protein V1761_00095 [bacterium]
MTIRKYRTIDLVIFTAIACILDVLIGRFGLFGGRQYFGLSTVFILVCYVRWGKYGLIANGIVLLVNSVVNYVDLPVAIAHAAGILGLSIALVLLEWSALRVRRPGLGAVSVYFFAAYVVMFFVEFGMLVALGRGLPLIDYAVNRIFDLILGWGLLVIIALQKDILVPMNLYIQENSEGK